MKKEPGPTRLSELRVAKIKRDDCDLICKE